MMLYAIGTASGPIGWGGLVAGAYYADQFRAGAHQLNDLTPTDSLLYQRLTGAGMSSGYATGVEIALDIVLGFKVHRLLSSAPTGVAPRGFDVASQAAKGFKNLECRECAAAIAREMRARGLAGEMIELSTDVNRPFIYSDRFGGVISQNGTHQAVRIGDTVFDNLNPNGIPFDEWLKDLHSVHGFDITITPF